MHMVVTIAIEVQIISLCILIGEAILQYGLCHPCGFI